MNEKELNQEVDNITALKLRAEAALTDARADILERRDAQVNYEKAQELFRSYVDRTISITRKMQELR